MKRLLFKLVLITAVLCTAWTAFSASDWEAIAEEAEADLGKYSELFARWKISRQFPPRFQKVLVLFSADTTKEDRDAFLAGLEEVRLRHLKDYHELVRKWWEIRETEEEKEYDEGTGEYRNPAAWRRFNLEQEFERDFYHNPYFLKLVDVRMIRTSKEGSYFDTENPNKTPFRPWDLDSIDWNFTAKFMGKGVALIVVASDGIAAEVTRRIQEEGSGFLSVSDDTVVLFAGVSSFDESIRERQMAGDDVVEFPRAPYAFAIKHPADPWPNTDLALSVFPKTKKIILLTPEKLWDEEKETAFKEKLGPGKMLKTIPMSEVDDWLKSDADIAEIKRRFAASVKAEIQPDTVIVTLSSVETGQDPASWLPADFSECPVFTDTKPVRTSEVGGFCRSMKGLGIQTAELLERLSEDSLPHNSLPPVVMEQDELWLNTAAMDRYGLKTSVFPDANLTDSESGDVVTPGEGNSWARRHAFFIHAATAAVLFALFAFLLLSVRNGYRKRRLSELIYGALPVRVIVTDRDGRIIAHHDQYGELEQKGEFLWKSIGEVPWLQGSGALKLVHDVFDSGKTVVREMEIDGEHRVVVLARTQSDVFGRPAVIAVSSISPRQKPQA